MRRKATDTNMLKRHKLNTHCLLSLLLSIYGRRKDNWRFMLSFDNITNHFILKC